MSNLSGVEIFSSSILPARPIRGLYGITILVAPAVNAKVIDLKGNNVASVRLVQNGLSVFTDSNGNAIANFLPGNIIASKGRWTKIFNYTGGNQFSIIYDPRIISF